MKRTSAYLLQLGLWLSLAAVPAMAGDIYDNGPTNGNSSGWDIAFGYVVSDTFNVAASGTTITGANFAMWLYPGDMVTSAELSITLYEYGGDMDLFRGTVDFSQGQCTMNQSGFNICEETTTFNGPTLNAGTYWLNLQNGSVPSGDPVYWDENSGPSMASENSVGSIPSESFTVLGSSTSTTTTTTTTSSSVPEPSSVMLFGSGILGLAGWLRRKLF